MNAKLSPKPRVVHLIPYDGIGGVETAARSVGCLDGPFALDLMHIYELDAAGHPVGLYNPWHLLTAAYRLIRLKPDLLVVSLWRSGIVGLLVQFFCSRVKLVLFVHNPQAAHGLDQWVTQKMALRSMEVWADSQASLDGAWIPRLSCPRKVISFLTVKWAALPVPETAPVFVWWGRLSLQKRLDKALQLFAAIHRVVPSARFVIAGPDMGVRVELGKWIREYGLERVVHVEGPFPHASIANFARRGTFFLQTSDYEGMSIAVIEAMQLGLIPVVTPVGEIARYCRHLENAVFVGQEEDTVQAIEHILRDSGLRMRLRRNAIATWESCSSYRDSFATACQNALSQAGLLRDC